MAVWIRVTEAEGAVTSRHASPANGKSFELAELQRMVGGDIEALTLTNGKVMWLNENGKLEHLPYNPVANLMARQMGANLREDDMIVGDVVVATMAESGEDEDDERND